MTEPTPDNADANTQVATPNWYPDPTGRFEYRFYNGQQWTADVSVNGHRSVDPFGTAMPVAGTIPGVSVPPEVSGTLATVAFVLGIIGVVTAWIPVVFVVGLLAALSALATGTVALRRTRAHKAPGKRKAIVAMVLGLAGLSLSVLGVILSVKVLSSVSGFVDPGPNTAVVNMCAVDGNVANASGTIVNRDTKAHQYVLTVNFLQHSDSVDTSEVVIDTVQPGATATWATTGYVGAIEADWLRCTVRSVTGPYPWGLSP